MNLQTPVAQLGKIGKQLDKKLKNLGIRCVQDLLFYLPFRYEDYSNCRLIKDLIASEQVTIRARVELIEAKRSWKKRKLITEAIVSDESGRMKIIWFGQLFIAKILKPGDTVYFSGKVSADKLSTQLVNPSYEKETRAKASGEEATTHTARIVPMYHLTSGISHKQLRFLVKEALPVLTEVKEWLPEEILEKADLITLADAVRGIHFPADEVDLKQCLRRLKFGELYILQLRAEMIRQALKRSRAPILEFKEEKIKEFVASLPFKLTKAQKVASWEILRDLSKEEPMNRLLEGDVGSGKTVVAAMSMYNAALNRYQAVLMCPTEILGMQHYTSLKQLLGDRASIALLTRSQFLISKFFPPQRDPVFAAGQFSNPAPEQVRCRAGKSKLSNDKISKKQVVDLIKKGDVDIIVGTHALLSEGVEFKNLGLAIVDEQHRFGVEQRAMLNQCKSAHYLSMTATPIPRSFALVLYGDLDLSIINEMPPGRKPVKTRLVEPENRDKAYQFIREQVKLGRQVFVICPLISVGTGLPNLSILGTGLANLSVQQEKKSVMQEYEKLSQKIFPDLEIEYLHGRMKSKEKEAVMSKFRNNEINILVSTSVVEVGVDIPNASVMMIEGAERFGLAQLHQFRGRVGRAEHQSYCLVFSETDNVKALERLQYFEQNLDGFKVAEYDLQTRGPGEVYGTTQHGELTFRLASLRDVDLIKLSRDLAKGIDFNKYPQFKEKVKEWERGVHLE